MIKKKDLNWKQAEKDYKLRVETSDGKQENNKRKTGKQKQKITEFKSLFFKINETDKPFINQVKIKERRH
jgi:hypothetical protein